MLTHIPLVAEYFFKEWGVDDVSIQSARFSGSSGSVSATVTSVYASPSTVQSSNVTSAVVVKDASRLPKSVRSRVLMYFLSGMMTT